MWAKLIKNSEKSFRVEISAAMFSALKRLSPFFISENDVNSCSGSAETKISVSYKFVLCTLAYVRY